MKKKTIYSIILIIIVGLIIFKIHEKSHEEVENNQGLLSPRVYQGILQEESKLLFNFEPLEEAIKEYISKKDETISVYLINARDSSALSINNEIQYEPASLNKLPLAIAILNKVEKGELNLNDILEIKDENRDASSGELYKIENKEKTIDELLREMLVNSDNTAYKVLVEQVTKEEIEKLSYYLDYYQYNELSKYYTVNAESNVRLFSSLYLSTVLKKENSEKILSYMTDSTLDIHKISGIPEDIKVSHKFANYYQKGEQYFHDCGIMYLENSRMIYCIMTKDISGVEAEQIIGSIVHSIHQYVTKSKNQIIKEELV